MGAMFRTWLRRTAVAAVAAGLWLGIEAASIEGNTEPFVRSHVQQLPTAKVGLVLGCVERLPDGRRNAFFVNRMAAAAELYRSGKVGYLLLSGDNSRADYDEPSDMRRALERLGVPRSRLVLDHAGFRTLDSVVRAKDVFGVERLILVSQHFHNVRAVYLARAHGIEAYAFDAQDVGGLGGAWPKLREVASRLFAVLDVKVFGTTPRFTGPPEPWRFRDGVDEGSQQP